jgi:PAS domain S-box-containing protein
VSTTAVPSRRPWWLIVIFVVLTAALAGVGVKILRDQRQWLEDVARRATKSTTETRANDLLGWRQDRLAEAAALAPNRQLLSQSLAVLGPSPSDDAQLAWSQSLAIVLSHRDHIGAALFDSAGRFCRSAGNVSSTGRDRARAVVAVAQRTRNVELSDPYRDDEGSVHVQVAIPLEDQRGASATPPIAVVLEIDAQRTLMSVLRGRAMPSADSDILLVRQQSDGVVVLVAVHGAGALDVGTRIPANAGDAIVERVAKGEEGPFDGRTLNGAPAIGVTRKVGHTGWWLISLVSSEAAIAQTMMESWRLAAIVGLMVLATGSVLMLVWQRRQAALYRELYETEAGRQRLAESFGYVTRFANDIIVMADGDGKIVEANDRAVEAYGYTREEFIGLPLAALRAPEIKETVASDLHRLKTDGHFAYQAEHARKDGTRFPVDLRARHFTEHGRTYFHGVIRDITERVAMERSLRDSAETYRTLFEQANDAIVVADAETGVILDANQKTAALTGRSVEELDRKSVV